MIRFPDVNAVIGMGSNVSPRGLRLRQALELISNTPGIRLMDSSNLRETQPWGYVDQPFFLNSAASIQTTLSALDLLAVLKRIEKSCHRVPRARNHMRELDLDLLIYGQVVMESHKLNLPHPGLLSRHFALGPAAAVLPRAQHPQTGRSLMEHLHAMDPSSAAVS